VYETTDSSVMRQVRDGDLGSMAVLFERHHRALLNYFVHMNGNRDFSEDLVQDVFVRMMKYRQSYQPDKPFTAWMYQIARNAQSDAMQKRKFEVELGHADVSMTHGMDEKLKREQEIELLRRAMARLSVDKRELLVLSRFQNLKYEEIASILGCEVGAVKVRVYRAVRALGQDMGVPVIRRSDLIKSWLASGKVTEAQLMAADGLHMADEGYARLAADVAREVLLYAHVPATRVSIIQ